jgi:hypothetical protein
MSSTMNHRALALLFAVLAKSASTVVAQAGPDPVRSNAIKFIPATVKETYMEARYQEMLSAAPYLHGC